MALCGFDRVSVIPFPDNPAGAGSAWGALQGGARAEIGAELFSKSKNRAGGEGHGEFSTRLCGCGALEARQAGVAVVLSDFLDPAGYEAGLTVLVGRGFQVNAVQILAPEELSPTTFGDLRLIDAETGALQEVTFGRFRMASYQQMVHNFCQKLRETCQTRGVSFFMAASNTSA